MNKRRLIDSSCWIEIFTDGPASSQCERYRSQAAEIIVPSLVFYEVYKKILTQLSEDSALSVVACLSQYKTVNLDRDTALLAGDISAEHGLAMADSMILAHSQAENAVLITRDFDFYGLPDVVVIK